MADLSKYYSKRNPKGDEKVAIEAMKQYFTHNYESPGFGMSKAVQAGVDAIGYKPSKSMMSFITDEASRMAWWIRNYDRPMPRD